MRWGGPGLHVFSPPRHTLLHLHLYSLTSQVYKLILHVYTYIQNNNKDENINRITLDNDTSVFVCIYYYYYHVVYKHRNIVTERASEHIQRTGLTMPWVRTASAESAV